MQEQDPSADEAFAAARHLQEQGMQSTAGVSTSAMAVDGFVPKFQPKKGSYHQPKAVSQSGSAQPSNASQDSALHCTPPNLQRAKDLEQVHTATVIQTARLMSNGTDAAELASGSSGAAGSSVQPASAGPDGAGSQPVISFELEDAEGPLQGAEHGINAKFGRLKVLPCPGGRILHPSQPTSCVDVIPALHACSVYVATSGLVQCS